MSQCLAVLLYVLYGHPRYSKFKQKYQHYGPCFQTIFPFLIAMSWPFIRVTECIPFKFDILPQIIWITQISHLVISLYFWKLQSKFLRYKVKMFMNWQNSFNERSFYNDLELLSISLVNNLECKVEKLEKPNYCLRT